MAHPWTRPAEARAWLDRKWRSGALLTAFAEGKDWEPLSVPLRGPVPGEIAGRLAEVQEWAAEWARADRGPLRVEYQKVPHGRQPGPPGSRGSGTLPRPAGRRPRPVHPPGAGTHQLRRHRASPRQRSGLRVTWSTAPAYGAGGELRSGVYEQTAHVTGDEEYPAVIPFPVTVAPSKLVMLR